MITNVKNVRRELGAKKELIPVIAVQMGKCLMLGPHLKSTVSMVSITVNSDKADSFLEFGFSPDLFR